MKSYTLEKTTTKSPLSKESLDEQMKQTEGIDRGGG